MLGSSIHCNENKIKNSLNCAAFSLCTDPSVNSSRSSDNTDPFQINGDVLADHNEFVGGLPDKSGGLQVTFEKKLVPC